MKTLKNEQNPFPFSDSNKRYHTYDYALRHRYGGKVSKVVLDAGFTCPNIDGTRGKGGCIYCSRRGSGDFSDPSLGLREQYEKQRSLLLQKWQPVGWIPYLQAHTNTYGTVEHLRAIYEEVLSFPDIVGISVATRADCITPQIASLLAEVSLRTDLTVELGLQSVNDETAKRINRCHTYGEFLEGYGLLRAIAPRAQIAIHLINGLPGEDEAQMLATVQEVAALKPDQIKLHLLHVLKVTPLAELYLSGRYQPMEQDAYVRCVVKQLEWIPPQTVIGRITGDAPSDDLIAPLWSRKKLNVMNQIDKLMAKENTWQGRFWI